MEIVMRKVGTLTPYERNTKLHDQKQIDNVANSIQRFGWQQPIVIDEQGVVVIGHCRLLAAKKLGMEEVPVTVASGLTEDEIRELRIADNKTNESAWDFAALEAELADLSFDGFDLDLGTKETENEEDDEPVTQNEYDNEEFVPDSFDDEIIKEYKEHEEEFLAKKRVIITYAPERELQLCEFIGVDPDTLKIVYDLSELVDE